MATVKRTDVVQDDFWANYTESAKAALAVEQELNKELVKTSEIITKNAKAFDGSSRAQREMIENERKSKRVMDEKIKQEEKIAKIRQNLTKVSAQQRKTEAELRTEQQRRNKIAREEAKLTNQNLTLYERQSLRLNKLRKDYKNLILEQGKETKQTRALLKEIRALDTSLKNVDAKVGQFQRSVGNYNLVNNKAVAGVKKLVAAFGVVGGIQLFTRVVRDAFNVVKNFDQSQADLASVLGVNREDMAALTAQAKELGATTKFTASQVAELQLEFAKLGFTQEQIEGMTEQTLQLAAAAGTELGNAAAIVGATMRGFGLDVSETQRVTDVMAKSFSASSLDIEKFKVAMAAVAPAAATAGFSIEETTALIGTLTNAGIDASTAGTGLRNIFLELTKKGLTFEEAMAQISGAADQNAAALDLFGKRGATLGVILANNAEGIDDLTESLEDSAGAAGEMADKQLDTLGGALDLLRSAWEGYILGADGASGASEKLKDIIKFLADNFEAIMDVLTTILKLWASYKLAMNAATVASNLFGKSLTKLKSAFGLIGLAILAAIKIYQEFSKILNKTTLLQERSAELHDEVATQVDKERVKMFQLRDEIFKTNAASEERQKIIDKINEQYGTTLENLEDEVAFMQQLEVAYKNYINQLEKRIQLQVLEKELVAVTEEILKFNRILADTETADIVKDSVEVMKEETEAYKRELQRALFALEQQGVTTEEVTETTIELTDATEGLTKANEKSTKALTEEEKKLNELNELRKRHALELMELENQLIRQGVDAEQRQTILFEKQVQQRREQGDLIVALDFEDKEILIKHTNDYLKFVEKGEIDRVELTKEANLEIEEDTAELYDKLEKNQKSFADKFRDAFLALKEPLVDFFNFVEKRQQRQLENIDRQIEAQKKLYDDSQERENQIREIAKERGLEANESITEQRDIQKAALLEQRELENKRQKVEALIAALQLLSAKISQGDGNAVANVKSSIANIKSFIDGAFFEGTETTVKDALGAPQIQGRDGYFVRVDGREKILRPSLSAKTGDATTDEIVDGFMAHKNLISNNYINKILDHSEKAKSSQYDKAIASGIKELVKETKANHADQGQVIFDALTGAFKYKSKLVTKHFPLGRNRNGT